MACLYLWELHRSIAQRTVSLSWVKNHLQSTALHYPGVEGAKELLLCHKRRWPTNPPSTRSASDETDATRERNADSRSIQVP